MTFHPKIDPSKPNHYDNDSLGEPLWCKGNHNHPDLEDMAADAADRATCTRCGVKVLEQKSAAALLAGMFDVPVTGFKDHFVLCGKCGIDFREFLHPTMLDYFGFQATKMALLELWG